MVDPNLVPKVRLSDGALVPAVGIGTFASDNYTADVVAAVSYTHLTMQTI